LNGAAWTAPPAQPELGDGDAAVWLLAGTASQPVESVLARHLGIDPAAVTLTRSAAGKPVLAGSPYRASLAHTGEVALVAVALGREVGVDVERPREGIEGWSLVRHALRPTEREGLESLPAGQRGAAFLSLWTRKEAILKAAGTGLAIDPQLVELGAEGVVAIPAELGRPEDWTLVEPALPLPGYAAALALRGRLRRLSLYDARSLAQ
jgi:4'-phosphopantetheinyl transferase